MHDSAEMPTSRMKEEIARLLKDEGYIRTSGSSRARRSRRSSIELKFGRNRERVITDLKRVSKPGRRVYARKDRLPRVLGGLGTAILSTSTGVITSRQAAGAGVGGEVHRLRLVSAHVSRIGRTANRGSEPASPSGVARRQRERRGPAGHARAAGARADEDRRRRTASST